MAYSDDRRQTISYLYSRSVRVGAFAPKLWLYWNTEANQPYVTRDATGLRRYRIVSNQPELITEEQFEERFGYRSRSHWTGVKPTGLHITTVEDDITGERYSLPAMGNGATVWIVDPSKSEANTKAELARAEAHRIAQEAAQVPEVPQVTVESLQARVSELEAELAQLREKHETPCKGLVHGVHFAANGAPVDDIRHCGGFLGHSGECAEVW